MLSRMQARSGSFRQVLTAGLAIMGLALMGAASAWAQPTLDVTKGAVGTQFTITGTGFGAVPGKVLFWPENPVTKPPRIAVVSWTNTSIVAVVGACSATMDCDVQVLPKGAITPITADNGFEVRRPNMDSISPVTGGAGALITISGEYFGAVRPRVYLDPQTIGAKPFACTVVAYSDTAVDFLVPEKAGPGVYHLWIINSVSADGKDDAFTITP